jgi:hypothetical protein
VHSAGGSLLGLIATAFAGLGYAAVSAGASADTQIATTKLPTPVRSWGGVAAFSLHDQASGSYRLAISRHAGAPELVAVAAQATAFDLDVGPGERGSPTIVYSRCSQPGPPPRGCDLYRYSLSTGTESKLVGASAESTSETAPTIWHGRVAWARLSDGAGADHTPRIVTRRLSAPRSRPSRRLPGIPSGLCRHGGCAVRELELRGRRLALNVGSPGPVCSNGQIRLDSLAGRAFRVARTTCGLDGQTFVGVSFDARNLYFARFCQVGRCDSRVGAFRYSVRTARYSLAPSGERLTGFSYDAGGRAYEVLAPDTAFGYCGNSVEEAPTPIVAPDCKVVLTSGLTFAPTRSLH